MNHYISREIPCLNVTIPTTEQQTRSCIKDKMSCVADMYYGTVRRPAGRTTKSCRTLPTASSYQQKTQAATRQQTPNSSRTRRRGEPRQAHESRAATDPERGCEASPDTGPGHPTQAALPRNERKQRKDVISRTTRGVEAGN